MGRIQVLSDPLINRIAAGEVIERPASAVKELLENSLDAGAGTIRISVAGGGRGKIRVVDDGCGMDRDDALLALERHATSKLSSPRDLEAIATLGFRGEALSSIAAVSRFVLQTAVRDGQGTEVLVDGGRIRAVREAGLPRGTSIRVDGLFFNVPARRKFLRTEATELSHIVRLVTRYALARPGIRLELEQGGRSLLSAGPVQSLEERVAQIYGRDFAARLLPFDLERDSCRVHGLAGRPTESSPRRDGQHHFVNGRAATDRILAHAVGEAYGNTMPRGRHPGLFLFVELDPERVDVNVHPQKAEVRFREADRIHDLVRDAVATALSHEAAIPTYGDLRPAASPATEVAEPFSLGGSGSPAAAGPVHVADTDGDAGGSGNLLDSIHAADQGHPARRAVPLAQYRDSYIVAQDREGLVLVDQHAAHERVIFERYLAAAEENRVEVQKLLFPLTVELAPSERILLEAEADEFRRLGFVVEEFGGSTIRLDGIPAEAGRVEAEPLLRELLGEAARAKAAAADLGELRYRVVTSAACQAAIKVNYPLTRDTMQRLLDDLFATVNPSTCPHGRPALFRLSLEELERAFRRR